MNKSKKKPTTNEIRIAISRASIAAGLGGLAPIHLVRDELSSKYSSKEIDKALLKAQSEYVIDLKVNNYCDEKDRPDCIVWLDSHGDEHFYGFALIR